MSLRTLLYFYGWRLRAHPFQELLAGAGIAIGVALLFAVQVANTSITGSVDQLIHAIIGNAQMELAARDDQGFDQRLLAAVRDLPGVTTAAPSLERRGVVSGPRGREAIELIGVDPSLASLDGVATRDFGPGRLQIPSTGILIPDRLAGVTGVQPGQQLTFYIGGRAEHVRVAATLSRAQIGSLVGSSVAIAPLAYAQRLAQMPGLVSRIFVHARAGAVPRVRHDLRTLAADRLNVGPADSTVQRLRSATAPNDQSTVLFSAISAMVGLLFAFNAMLLTMPERRAFVAELRTQGFTPRQIVAVLGFQALMLGLAASVLGIAVGDFLSRTVFHAVPTYLAFTFPIGTQRIVPAGTVLLALGAGVFASLLASSRPLADLVPRRALDAVYDERGELGEGLNRSLRKLMLLAAVVLLGVTTIVVGVAPRVTIVGVMTLAVTVLLAMPATFAAAVPLIDRLARRLHGNMLVVATMGTRAAMTRSVAVGAVAALAVFGSVAIGGARNDLVHGLEAGFADHVSTADIWVTTVGRSLTTDAFRLSGPELTRLRHAPGVASVRTLQGGMLDMGGRRVWVVARPAGDRRMLPATQIVSGNLARAERELHEGGWVGVSRTLADARGAGIGQPFAIPTPSGTIHPRLAAIVTNLGWGSGAIVMNTRDYTRAWQTTDASAIEVDLRPHVSPAAGQRNVRLALGPNRVFDVQTASELRDEFDGVLHEGLTRLTQISTLMLVAAALALAAAMSAAVWQRRQRLAAYKVQGFKEPQLRRILMLEAIVTLAIGCTIGAAAGAYGHRLGNRWLELTTGFPAPFALQGVQALVTILSVIVGAGAIVAGVGYFAARVSPRLSFHE